VAPVTLPPPGLTFALAVPSDPSLCGAAVFLQGLLLDPGATGAVAVTPGTRLGLGR
jgi:hypothetical protein